MSRPPSSNGKRFGSKNGNMSFLTVSICAHRVIVKRLYYKAHRSAPVGFLRYSDWILFPCYFFPKSSCSRSAVIVAPMSSTFPIGFLP